MTETTHDLIAADEARLRKLIRLAKPGSDEGEDAPESSTKWDDDTGPGPTWSGWNN